jgi:HAD superfamily hydrolase (TIGR01549 family)
LNINHLKGLIFDLDGTLADTALDFAQMCKDAGLPVGTKILEHCEQLNDPNRVTEILTIVERHELAGAIQASWILDAEKVLHQLHTANIPLAIVTRNMQKAAELTIERLNIPINLVITREDCEPKPSPKGLLKVASQWQINPTELAYIGDFQFDIQAAKQANMTAILLANQRNQHLFDSADYVIEDFSPLAGIIQ